MKNDFDAMLLISFGGPNSFDEVRPFLANVLRGRPVPPARIEKVVEQYAAIGGASPLNKITARQAESLAAQLKANGDARKVYVGMKNWPPYIKDAVIAMKNDNVKRALGVPLAPHRSEASWEKYVQSADEAVAETGASGMQIKYCEPWHTHPLFIEAICKRVRESFPSGEDLNGWHGLFTAHSIPVEMDKQSGYSAQILETVRAVTEKIGCEKWSVCYQSRSGRPDEPWLEPDINLKINELASSGIRSIFAVPVGFVCDHVEVLFDLDMQARKTAETAGLNWKRVSTVGEHPQFIRMLAELQ